MIFTSWRNFVPLVRQSTAKCPVSGMAAQVREAAREFCARARIWTDKSLVSDVLAGEGAYGLRPPDQADIRCVLSVRFQGARLTPLTPDQWRSLAEQTACAPTHFIFTEPNVVRLYPTPQEDVPGALLVEVVLIPAVNSAQGPEFLLSKHGTTIAHGAISKLMLMPDRPWSDPGGGAFYEKKFEDGVAGATINVEQGGAGAPASSQYRPFFD
ncbi:MAG: hypothetical protein FD177_892 [Desulfovibrionaceae bacterium]|nr:MAG: hypothetical protein FD177_892 [Desulfovibrionaceae bacterium]